MTSFFFRRGLTSQGTKETVVGRDRAFSLLTKRTNRMANHLKLMPEDDGDGLAFVWFSKYLVLRQQLDQVSCQFEDLCFEFVRGHGSAEYKSNPLVASFLAEMKAELKAKQSVELP